MAKSLSRCCCRYRCLLLCILAIFIVNLYFLITRLDHNSHIIRQSHAIVRSKFQEHALEFGKHISGIKFTNMSINLTHDAHTIIKSKVKKLVNKLSMNFLNKLTNNSIRIYPHTIDEPKVEKRTWKLSKIKIGVDPKSALNSITDKSQSFTCVDNSKTIKLDAVNDDYCDCQDGSDEPGTSACSNGRFFCPVEQKFLASWYVNDGICDCCDGADEWKNNAPLGLIYPKQPTAHFAPCTMRCGT